MNLDVKDNMTAKMQKLKQMFESADYSDVLTAGINIGMGVFKQRIFNKGQDVTGEPFGGYYSKEHIQKREGYGRQVGYKDLELTGALRQSIDLVTIDPNTVQVKLTDPELTNIAHFQESQIARLKGRVNFKVKVKGKDFELIKTTPVIIFKFSEQEKDIAKTQTNRLLQQKIKSIVQG